MNGSPLFTGDATSGESEIRRWIVENDWLEAIVALPEQLFYNTGIPTYVWVLTNRKPKERRGKVQLIDATSFWTPMRKSLGDKRREISPEQIQQITLIFENFKEAEHSKLFSTSDFGYRKITVERSLRMNFQATPERIDRLQHEKAILNLTTTKKKGKAGEAEVEAGRRLRQKLISALKTLDADQMWKNRKEFLTCLDRALTGLGGKVPAPVKKAILAALSERDETAEICLDDEGHPEADPELRDTENVPLGEDVNEFFKREVKPHVPDAWINTAIRDHKDKEVGKVGYEINFNRYFYQYQPPRPLEGIEADIKAVEKDIVAMLREVAG
jgi:type I restriction enzyme M protein